MEISFADVIRAYDESNYIQEKLLQHAESILRDIQFFDPEEKEAFVHKLILLITPERHFNDSRAKGK